MFVCCECCVLLGRGLRDELITRPEGSCDLETSIMRTLRAQGLRAMGAKKNCQNTLPYCTYCTEVTSMSHHFVITIIVSRTIDF